MTAEAVNMEAVALAVSDVLAVLESEPVVIRASVSGVYVSPPAWYRCCVSVTWRENFPGAPERRRVFQPRFMTREDAEAYRVAVGEALDRAI